MMTPIIEQLKDSLILENKRKRLMELAVDRVDAAEDYANGAQGNPDIIRGLLAQLRAIKSDMQTCP